MQKDKISQLNLSFNNFTNKEDNIEFWYARDLQKLLGYTKWTNFEAVIKKAMLACKGSKYDILDHFADVSKMIGTAKGAEREVVDYKLSRYACYLIAQNGDPRKETIAFAQTYFAVQTRKQEILEERMAVMERLEARKKLSETEKELSRNIYQRGVDSKGFGRIRGKGDTALFGGKNTREMKDKLKVSSLRPLADFLPTVTIKAKDLATEITNVNLKKNKLYGENEITSEHVGNNEEIRGVLTRKGIYPEELPAEEDIKKVGKEIKFLEKQLGKQKIKKIK
jgi:DNA-damage-inducible protein D